MVNIHGESFIKVKMSCHVSIARKPYSQQNVSGISRQGTGDVYSFAVSCCKDKSPFQFLQSRIRVEGVSKFFSTHFCLQRNFRERHLLGPPPLFLLFSFIFIFNQRQDHWTNKAESWCGTMMVHKLCNPLGKFIGGLQNILVSPK